MSNLVLPVVGAAIGSIWGPTGAQIGWMAGSVISNARSEIKQGTIGDVRVQTSSYGTYIPYCIGRQRLAGNIIWAADKTTYDIKTKTSKMSPTTVTPGYRVSMAIGICKGPILGISRVWANETLIIDSRDTAKPLIGELYLGTDTQLPDPTYEAAVGVGNAPAYRGMAYIVLTDFDLGADPAIPQFSFEVIGRNVL